MNVTRSRSVVNVGRVDPTASTLAGATSPADQFARGAALVAQGTIDAARRSTAAKRGASLTRLESQVRGGDYAPDATLVAGEILADARVNAGIKSIVQH